MGHRKDKMDKRKRKIRKNENEKVYNFMLNKIL